jgi:hypothetical protein
VALAVRGRRRRGRRRGGGGPAHQPLTELREGRCRRVHVARRRHDHARGDADDRLAVIDAEHVAVTDADSDGDGDALVHVSAVHERKPHLVTDELADHDADHELPDPDADHDHELADSDADHGLADSDGAGDEPRRLLVGLRRL